MESPAGDDLGRDGCATGIGSRVARTEDAELLAGRARYVDDLAVGALRVAFVRSPHAHARVVSVDASAALAAPGVVGVLTAADLALAPIRAHRILPPVFDRPPLAVDVARFAGEPVAAVVAATRAAAVDAAELVEVAYEPLEPVVDPRRALDPGAPVLFGPAGTNLAFERLVGDEAAVLGGAEVVVRATLVNQRVASAPMEPDGVLAAVDTAGVLTVHASTQRVHQVRDAIATSLGLEPERVRVVAPAVGGGFGGKFEPSPEAVVVAALAHRLGRAVAWTQTRAENLLTMPHGRGQVQHGALGLTRDGTFTGLWADIVGDAGAYPMVGAVVPNATLSMLPSVYRWRDGAGGRVRSAATNTTPVGAFRGAGRPEACALVERLVDLAAAEVGIDAMALRRRNLVPADAFPYRSATGMTYDSGDYARCLDGLTAALRVDEWRAEQHRRRSEGDPRALGIGVAMWIDCTPMNRPGEYAAVELVPDDGADGFALVVRDGANDQGQAHRTTWALLLADVLGTPVRAVRLPGGDTGAVPHGEGTGSARSLQLAGASVWRCAHDVLDQARSLAADLLEASTDDVVLARESDGGSTFTVRGTPTRRATWAQVAAAAATGVGVRAVSDVDQPGPTFPSGAHGAVVEVDPETGAVRLLALAAVDDCGTVVNPVVVEGQQHGGMVQGVSQALWEQVVFDPDGTPRTSSLGDYLVPSAAELCPIDARTIGLDSPVNPLGAKGIGQAGAIGATPAVQSAVLDALAPLGVRHVDLPLTPERVWRAIGATARGEVHTNTPAR